MANEPLNPRVSIIIVSYNCAPELADCIDSIHREAGDCAYEIIVVDNNSTDETLEILGARYPEAILVANNDNVGFAKANNQGLAKARGAYTLYLNPDTIILENAIDKMIGFLEERPEVGLVGPHVFNRDGVTTQETTYFEPTVRAVFHKNIPLWRLIPGYTPKLFGEVALERSMQVYCVKGCCMMLSTALARDIGGMNEEYFMFSEEFDVSEAIQARGLQVYYWKGAAIIHLGGASTEPEHVEMTRERMRSLKKYFSKRHSAFSLTLIRIFMFIGSVWRFMAWKISGALGLKDKKLARSRCLDHRAIMSWLYKDFA